jgi:isopenicillin N synthase-like dioxygenase
MEITKIDLRGLEPGKPGWDEARAALTASMVAYGCVVVQHIGLDRDIWQALFFRAMPELFTFPVETKQRNVYNDVQHGGYIGQLPGLASYESMSIEDVTDDGTINDFANLFWPQGNPAFW